MRGVDNVQGAFKNKSMNKRHDVPRSCLYDSIGQGPSSSQQMIDGEVQCAGGSRPQEQQLKYDFIGCWADSSQYPAPRHHVAETGWEVGCLEYV